MQYKHFYRTSLTSNINTILTITFNYFTRFRFFHVFRQNIYILSCLRLQHFKFSRTISIGLIFSEFCHCARLHSHSLTHTYTPMSQLCVFRRKWCNVLTGYLKAVIPSNMSYCKLKLKDKKMLAADPGSKCSRSNSCYKKTKEFMEPVTQKNIDTRILTFSRS
jgi:hypothetical protein